MRVEVRKNRSLRAGRAGEVQCFDVSAVLADRAGEFTLRTWSSPGSLKDGWYTPSEALRLATEFADGANAVLDQATAFLKPKPEPARRAAENKTFVTA